MHFQQQRHFVDLHVLQEHLTLNILQFLKIPMALNKLALDRVLGANPLQKNGKDLKNI